jgi:hypothetical protein
MLLFLVLVFTVSGLVAMADGVDGNAASETAPSLGSTRATDGSESDQCDYLTVCDGSVYKTGVPVCGIFVYMFTKSQFVMPSDLLTDMRDGRIAMMRFYLEYKASRSWGNAVFQVYLKEVASATITAFEDFGDATLVYEGTLDATSNYMDVLFDRQYEYKGGNLLVSIHNTQTGDSSTAWFWGTGAYKSSSVYGRNEELTDLVAEESIDFVPKTTFWYVPDHMHAFSYEANGDVITATCETEGCAISGTQLKILPPQDLVCDGTAKTASIEDGYQASAFRGKSIRYEKDGVDVPADQVKDPGTYKASVTVGGVTASVTYTIIPDPCDYLTVCDGSDSMYIAPVYGGFVDDFTKSQFVISADLLTDMRAGKIETMRFYLSEKAARSWGNAVFQVYLKEVTSSTITAFEDLGDATLVYEGTLDITGDYMDVLFDSQYEYKGGNLLVSIHNTQKGNSVYARFVGTGAYKSSSVYGSGFNPTDFAAKTPKDFIPKTTFGYVPDHVHAFSYEANGDVITATCETEGCFFSGSQLKILPPKGLIYDGTAKTASIEEGYKESVFRGDLSIRYEKDGVEVPADQVKELGTYKASVTVGGVTASVTYTIIPDPLDHLTICDGSDAFGMIPIYGAYVDAFTKSQFVIPSDLLDSMRGGKIERMRFYVKKQSYVSWENIGFQVYLKEVASATINAFEDLEDAMLVYEGTLDATGEYMDVVFDGQYEYKGGNLLVSIHNTQKGDYSFVEFWGSNAYEYSSVYGYDFDSTDFVAKESTGFIPKTTFDYVSAHVHAFSYEANGDTITVTCDAEGCFLTGYAIRLLPPKKLYANGKLKVATIEPENYQDVLSDELVISYKKDGVSIPADQVTDPGTYVASTTIGGVTAQTEFTILPNVYVNQCMTCDGTDISDCVPTYGKEMNDRPYSQFIIPADELLEMTSHDIGGMRFYATSKTPVDWGNVFEVFLKETEATSISEKNGLEDAVKVYRGPLNVSDGYLDIDFDAPYNYQGGNLFVCVQAVTAGTVAEMKFYGIVANGASIQDTRWSINIQKNFLPKTTFFYRRTHEHSFSYVAEENSLKAICSEENCPLTGSVLTLLRPSYLIADGNVKKAKIVAGYNPIAFPDEYSIKYTKNGVEVPEDQVVEAGTYEASVTIGGATARVAFSLTPISLVESLDLYAGSGSDWRIPVYGDAVVKNEESQSVYAAEDLREMVDGRIVSMRFYLGTKAKEPWTGAIFRVYLRKFGDDEWSDDEWPDDFWSLEGATLVYEGPLDATGDQMDVLFDREYVYEGGNLLFCIQCIASGTRTYAYFKGIDTQGYYSRYGSREDGGHTSSHGVEFLPQTTFGYIPSHKHVFSYAVSAENVITATCETPECPLSGNQLRIVGPKDNACDGLIKKASLEPGYAQIVFPGEHTIVYTKDGQEVSEDQLTEPGTYTASVTVAGLTASVTFTLIPHEYESHLTISDDSFFSSFIPLYGFAANEFTQSQFVVPASYMQEMRNGTIGCMRFYALLTEGYDWECKYQVHMAEVENGWLSGFYDVSKTTLVYEGPLSIVNDYLFIPFDQDFVYHGGNLLVSIRNIEKGSSSVTDFYGKISNGASVVGNSTVSLDDITPYQIDFIPKTTFLYKKGHSVTFDTDGGTQVASQSVADGGTVKIPVYPKWVGHTFLEWQLNGQPYDFSTPVTEPITLTAKWADGTVPAFRSHAVMLSGQIGIVFYVDLSMLGDVLCEDVTMTFEGGMTEIAYYDANFTNQSGEYHGFVCHLNSAQMADRITATLHYGEGQELTNVYDLRQYVGYIADHPEGFSAEAISLVKAIADYGHYVKPFIQNYGTGAGSSSQIECYDVYSDTDVDDARTALAGYAFSKEGAVDKVAFTYTLALGSETSIYLYVKPKEGTSITDAGQIVVTKGGKAVSGVTVTWDNKKSRYEVVIPDLNALQLGDTYRVTIRTDDGDEITADVSALSYAYAILTNAFYQDKEDAKHAMVSLYKYHLATVAYVNASNQ